MKDVSISKYQETDEIELLTILKKDKDWEIITNDNTIAEYKKALKIGITFVARKNDSFCGFIRAIQDVGIAVYISELYVKENFRNIGIGNALIQRVKTESQSCKTYAFSDEDKYYLKKGYVKIGSVFEI